MSRAKNVLLMMCIVFMSIKSFAGSKTITVSHDFPIHLDLSVEHVNRIHFADKQIKKIVGDASGHSIILSENRKDMFVQLNVQQDQIINLSVIDVAGYVMDLEILAVTSKYPSIVTLKSADRDLKKESEEISEAKQMLGFMQKGLKGKYYTLDGGDVFNCGVFGQNVNCQIIADYRFGEYRGIGLKVHNKDSKTVYLDNNSISLLIPQKILLQQSTSCILPRSAEEIIYFVSKKED